MHAITEVARGGSVIDPVVVESLVGPGRTARLAASTGSPHASGRCSSRWRRAATTPASRRRCYLSERAVEKHINSLFSKLGLAEEVDVHRRVKAVLLFLSEQGG